MNSPLLRTGRRFCPTLFTLFAFLPGNTRVLGEQFVELSAELELSAYSGFNTNAPRPKPRIQEIRCVTGANAWQLEAESENAEEKWLFDGTNVYNSIRITKATPEDKTAIIEKTSRLAPVPFDRAKSNLTINVWSSRDGHPLGQPPINIAWLAFCSGTYLKKEGRLVPLPLDNLHHTRDRFAYTDKTATFEDAFGLPHSVDLFLSKTLFVASETDFDKEYSFGDRYTEWTRKAAEKLPEGAQMFHYQAGASTNFLGWNFPVKFEFSQQGRKFEQNGDRSWQGTGILKAVRATARPGGLFDPRFQQTIVDWRFKDGLIYTWTNNFLSPTNDPFLQEKHERRAAQLESMRKERSQGASEK